MKSTRHGLGILLLGVLAGIAATSTACAAAVAWRIARLTGATTLQRLQFGVGQGDWRGTEWLDDAVRVEFAVALEAVR